MGSNYLKATVYENGHAVREKYEFFYDADIHQARRAYAAVFNWSAKNGAKLAIYSMARAPGPWDALPVVGVFPEAVPE